MAAVHFRSIQSDDFPPSRMTLRNNDTAIRHGSDTTPVLVLSVKCTHATIAIRDLPLPIYPFSHFSLIS